MEWKQSLKTFFQKRRQQRQTKETLELADSVLAENDRILEESQSLVGQLNDLIPEELEWVEWFHALPKPQKKLVELCGERGIKVTADNIQQVTDALTEDSS